MRRYFLPLLTFFPLALSAARGSETEPLKTPSEIQTELNQAESDYDTARKMFSPYYSGPLLTGSAHNCPPGHVNIQPYLFATDTYGTYTGNRKLTHHSAFWTINPVFIFQTGLNKWLDVQVTPQGLYNTYKNQGTVNWGDMQATLGFQLIKETPYVPALRFTFSETFPFGRYDHLNPEKLGTDATGAGSYQTQLNLNISKVLWYFPLHPMQVRGNLVYIIPSDVDVYSFNSYGGGYGTNGTVSPGNQIQLYGSIEISIVQKWVFALDVVYKYFNKTTFTGTPGITTTGETALVGAPSGDQFSLAPAIEYNWSPVQQFIVGPWFTVFGRNSSAFFSIIVSYARYF